MFVEIFLGCIEREIKSKGRKEDENQSNKLENAKENLNKHVGSMHTLKKKFESPRRRQRGFELTTSQLTAAAESIDDHEFWI